MQERLYVEFFATLADQGFSLDELAIRTKEVYESEGMPGFVGLLLRLYEERICIELVSGKREWQWSRCCSAPRWEYYRSSQRKFRTSIGTVRIQWRRLKCRNCRGSIVPLREALQIRSYQSKTRELEKIVIELVSEQSYRRSCNHLKTIGEIPVPKSTAHRWVMQSDLDLLKIGRRRLEVVMADGTGYKPAAGEQKGELRVALGFTRRGEAIPLGSWSGCSWEEIGRQLREKLKRRKKVEILVCDGEPGLAEALCQLANRTQRCQWHQVHDLDRFMWMDKAPRRERRKAQSRLAAIFGIQLPEADYQPIKDAHKQEIRKSLTEALQKFETLTRELYFRGYHRAAVYMKRAKTHLFSYVQFWLETGIITPRVSSFLERTMREIARRIKKIGFGWSKKGVTKITYIIMKRFTSDYEWQSFWQSQMRISENVFIFFRGVKAA